MCDNFDDVTSVGEMVRLAEFARNLLSTEVHTPSGSNVTVDDLLLLGERLSTHFLINDPENVWSALLLAFCGGLPRLRKYRLNSKNPSSKLLSLQAQENKRRQNCLALWGEILTELDHFIYYFVNSNLQSKFG